MPYQVFGIGLFAARFWSAAFATILVGAVYFLGRALVGRKPALFAAIIFACAPAVVIMARLSGPQMVFAGCTTVALVAFIQSVFLGRKRWSPVFYAALALAVLTLGPIALLYFVFSSALYVAVARPSAARIERIAEKPRPQTRACLAGCHLCTVVLPGGNCQPRRLDQSLFDAVVATIGVMGGRNLSTMGLNHDCIVWIAAIDRLFTQRNQGCIEWSIWTRWC